MSIKSIVTHWNNFFFKPESTDGIAFFRIIFFTVLFISFLFEIGNVDDFYGPFAIIKLNTVRDQFPLFHLNIFHLFGVAPATVYAVMTVWGVALVTSIFGLYTRYSILTVLICMVSFHQRNIWLLSSAEVLMRLTTIYLLLSPCGHSLSIDSILGRHFPIFKKEKFWAPWALRLIQLQTSVVYLWTVWHKLKGDDWVDGTALYYATRLEDMKNLTLPFLMDSILFIKTMTWATLIIETALGILLWFKETRYIVMLIGIIFHLGIEFTMSIPFFEILMIVLILSFLPSDYVSAMIQKVKKQLIQSIETTNIADNLKEKIRYVLKD